MMHGGGLSELVKRANAEEQMTIEFNEDSPTALNAVVEFLYTWTFNTKASSGGQEFYLCAEVFTMAKKYSITGLPQLALRRCEAACSPERGLELFNHAIFEAQDFKARDILEPWAIVFTQAKSNYKFWLGLKEDLVKSGQLEFDEREDLKVMFLSMLLDDVKSKQLIDDLTFDGSDDGNAFDGISDHSDNNEDDGDHDNEDGDDDGNNGGGNHSDSDQAEQHKSPSQTTPEEKPAVVPPHRRHDQKQESNEFEDTTNKQVNEEPGDNVQTQAPAATQEDWNDVDTSPASTRWPAVEADDYTTVADSDWNNANDTKEDGWAKAKTPGAYFVGEGRTLAVPIPSEATHDEQRKAANARLLEAAERERRSNLFFEEG
jgi:hypothetical protein